MGLMQISRRVDYGLRAVIYLAGQQAEKCCSIGEIAKAQGIPKKFLEKIVQDLLRAELIKSRRGSTGGYQLAKAAEAISFCDVIEAIEGPIAVNACMDHRLGCEQMPRCTMIGVWSEVQNKITEVLSRTTIAALKRSPCGEFSIPSSLSSAA
ncbi:MAG: Rrf2 family transcriptional regulator [Deltaproteobacteria bacterium]|jgi:Rrf2 family protein|nr:Rrf2 family transcriptional regulator [Deltaproteobacteria bacterium]